MKIAKALLILALLALPINAHADFEYLDRVVIVGGFYRGESGVLQEKIQGKYRVKLLPVGKIIMVSEAEIERCTRAESF